MKLLRLAGVLLFILCTNSLHAQELASTTDDTNRSLSKVHNQKILTTIAALEASSGGKIGIYAINTGNNQHIAYRANERFPFCSTGKLMVVSAILKKSMKDSQYLNQRIYYKRKDLVTYSLITEKHLADGMTISDLCDAVIRYSDNTAMNLLIKKLGGLSAVNDFALSIGDSTFNINRLEPDINTAIPGDLRDTTTPLSMAKDLQQTIFTPYFASRERELLLKWLKYNTTGKDRMRAGVPNGWDVSDKTGTGDYGTTNDVGILWPPKCPPIVLAIYYTQDNKNASPRADVIAKATRMVINSFSENNACLTPHSSLIPTADWMKPIKNKWYLQNPGKPYSIQVSSTIKHNGNDSIRFELRKGEKEQTNTTYRAEINTKEYAKLNSVRWYRYSLLLPSDFPIENNRLVLGQWHGADKIELGELPRSPSLAFRYIGGRFHITIRHSSERIVHDADNVPEEVLFEDHSFPLGQWNDFVIQAKWSYQNDGFVNIWWKGKQIVKYKGPVGYNDDKGPYFKFGIYRDDTDKTYVAYYNEVKSGDTARSIGFKA